MPELTKVALFTNEYPPNVYGGAGVHVEYLSRELAKLVDVDVRCFGDQDEKSGRLRVKGYRAWNELKEGTDARFAGALDAFSRDLAMAKDPVDAGVVHCHTWYTDMAGLIASKLWSVPLVVTTHSLEPLRPWKVEQLGTAYHLSSWMEKAAIEQADAVIAVSSQTKNEVLDHFAIANERVQVIHNGIDLDQYRKVSTHRALAAHGIDPSRPYVLFVGRITRQKGIIHLVNAIPHIDPSLQVVLAAGAPDTPAIGQEMKDRVAEVSASRPGVVWIQEMMPRADAIELYSHAAVFCCPSVYEPFGIINLEAMACGTAVVASSVGGIKEVVVPEETGILVDLALTPGTFDPADPELFSQKLANAINRVGTNESLQRRFGENGRKRVEARFSWASIARQTLELYRSLPSPKRR